MARPGIQPPIIVYGDGDTDIFEFTEDAERYLEPIDIEQITHVAYDSEGRLLHIVPTTPRVTIKSAEAQPTHQVAVRTLLTNFLTYLDVPEEDLSPLSLKELVMRSLEYKTE